jgi:hypothetical protein
MSNDLVHTMLYVYTRIYITFMIALILMVLMKATLSIRIHIMCLVTQGGQGNYSAVCQIIDTCHISPPCISGPKRCFVRYRRKYFLFTTTAKLFGAEICVAEIRQA